MANTTQKDTMFEANLRRLKWTITDKATGAALNLTGKVIKFAVARIGANGPVRTDPLVDKKTGHADIELIDASAGRVDTLITEVDSEGWAANGRTVLHVELEVYEVGEVKPIVVATVALTVLSNVENA